MNAVIKRRSCSPLYGYGYQGEVMFTGPGTLGNITMTKPNTKMLILSVAAAAAVGAIALPSLASADCYDRQHNARTTGAVVGAVAGAAIGNAASGHNKTAGTVLGAVVGAAVGSNVARSNSGHCYYDRGYDDRRDYRDDRRDYRDDRRDYRDDRRDYRDDRRDDRRDWRDDHR